MSRVCVCLVCMDFCLSPTLHNITRWSSTEWWRMRRQRRPCACIAAIIASTRLFGSVHPSASFLLLSFYYVELIGLMLFRFFFGSLSVLTVRSRSAVALCRRATLLFRLLSVWLGVRFKFHIHILFYQFIIYGFFFFRARRCSYDTHDDYDHIQLCNRFCLFWLLLQLL